MPIPTNKTELLEAIKTNYVKLEKDLLSISSQKATLEELEGHAKGTKMSVNNLLAYLIGWGELVLKWHSIIERKEIVDYPESGYKWIELGDLAQKFYADYAHLDFEESLKQFALTTQKIITLIENTPNEMLYGTSWYKNYSMGRMIQLNTASPFKNARNRVRKWKRKMQEK